MAIWEAQVNSQPFFPKLIEDGNRPWEGPKTCMLHEAKIARGFPTAGVPLKGVVEGLYKNVEGLGFRIS